MSTSSDDAAAPQFQDGIALEASVHAISGFSERSLSPTTIRGFILKVKLFIDKLLLIEELKETCFDLAEDGSFKYHTGAAADIRKLKLPLLSKAVQVVFMSVSKDARRKRKISALLEPMGNVNDVARPSTVVLQSFCHYRAALKFWHHFACPAMDKVASTWPDDVAEIINKCCQRNKRGGSLLL